MPSRVNELQKQVQTSETLSETIEEESFSSLNNIESQAWLYIEILNQLEAKSKKSQVKLASSIEALQRKRKLALKNIDSKKPIGYRFVSGAKRTLDAIFQINNDYEDLLSILDALNSTTIKSESSKDYSDLLIKLDSEINRRSKNLTPSGYRAIYKLEELISNLFLRVSLYEGSSDGSRSNYSNPTLEIINELSDQLKVTSKLYRDLLIKYQINEKEINKRDDIIANMQDRISELINNLGVLESDVNQLTKEKSNVIFDLENQHKTISELYKNQEQLEDKLNALEAHVQEKEDEIEVLEDELKTLSLSIKKPIGKYIGDLKKKGSCYHYKRNCVYYRALLQTYLEPDNKDENRDIHSGNDLNLFHQNGLVECQKCVSKSRKSSS